MKALHILSLAEYVPVHLDVVDVYLGDMTWRPLVGIELATATCHIHYQAYDAKDRCAVPLWTSSSPEAMEEIPFNTPFLHECSDPEDPDRITGFRLLEEAELEVMKKASQALYLFKAAAESVPKDTELYAELLEEYEAEMRKLDTSEWVYFQKRWFFALGGKDTRQIDDEDSNNELIGIIDKNSFHEVIREDLERIIKSSGE